MNGPESRQVLMAAATELFEALPLGDRTILSCIVGYFLLAAYFAGIRIRWGYSTKRRHPRMGPVSCLGFATFIGGVMVPSAWLGLDFMTLPAMRFCLTAVGSILDWVHDPPKFRK